MYVIQYTDLHIKESWKGFMPYAITYVICIVPLKKKLVDQLIWTHTGIKRFPFNKFKLFIHIFVNSFKKEVSNSKWIILFFTYKSDHVIINLSHGMVNVWIGPGNIM